MTTISEVSKISRAKHLAREILRSCGLTHPTDLSIETIAYAIGIDGVQSIPLYGAEGRIMARKGKFLISYSDALKHEGKRRFVIAHELGHFVLHRSMLERENVHTDRSRSFKDTSGQEAEANAFASELLMPAYLLSDTHFAKVPTVKQFQDFAEDFKVSLMALCIRYCEIGSKPSCLVISKKRIVEWSKTSPDFPYPFIKPGFAVDRTSLAAAFHDGLTPSVSRKKIAGNYWFGSNCEGELTEQAYKIGRDTIVTLIWDGTK